MQLSTSNSNSFEKVAKLRLSFNNIQFSLFPHTKREKRKLDIVKTQMI